jgi:hypothetical protein
MNDPISHPSHYCHGGIECIDAIRAALGPEGFKAYCRGNVLKYTWRAGHKGDPEASGKEDMQKAATYAKWASE